MEFIQLAEGLYLEGLSVDHKRNVIWYSDVIKGGIHGVTPDGDSVASFNESRMWTGGVLVNSDGCVLSSGPGGIMWNNPESGASGWLIHEIDGKIINGINEMWPDGKGGIFFGTSDIEMVEQAKPTRPTEIYRLTADRKLIRLADQVNFSNGLAFDPVRSKLYCSDTFNVVWSWDVDDDLMLSNRKVFLEKEDCDGMCLDSEGNVWVTGFRSGFLTIVKPDGSQLPSIETPKGSVTQVRFGGADARDFYINVVPADGGDSLKDGKELAPGSYLYRGRSSIPGVLVQPANFKLS